MEFLGEGIGRKVFSLDDKRVIKISKCPLGVDQNDEENFTWCMLKEEDKKWFAAVISVNSDRTQLVMERVIMITEEEFKKWLPELKTIISYLAKKYDLQEGDLRRFQSWGFVNRQLKLIDYGLTGFIRNKVSKLSLYNREYLDIYWPLKSATV